MTKTHAETKKYLMQVRRLDRAIDHELLEIGRLRALAANISATISGDKVQTSPTNRLEEMIVKIVTAEEEVDKAIDKLIEKKSLIISQINEIPDEECVDVLKFYFIDGCSFDNIPDKVNMSRRKVLYVYGRALDEFERLHGRKYLPSH